MKAEKTLMKEMLILQERLKKKFGYLILLILRLTVQIFSSVIGIVGCHGSSLFLLDPPT